MPDCRHSNFEIRPAESIFGFVSCLDCGKEVKLGWALKAMLEDIQKERAKMQEMIRSFEEGAVISDE